MAERIEDARVDELDVTHFRHETPKVCLRGLVAYQSEDPERTAKVEQLLHNLTDDTDEQHPVLSCTIGGCTVSMPEGKPTEVTGTCRAASYCLQEAFKAIGQTETVDEGRALHRDIIHSLDGRGGGNFCPRLECGLSAGVSVDMVPGTAGECVRPDSTYEPMLGE